MTLAASEVRLLKAARKIFETGESLVGPSYMSDPIEPHNISIDRALESCDKYFEGSDAAYRVAKGRLFRKFDAANKRRGFWAWSFLRENGYYYWKEIKLPDGGGRIVPGNVSEETFHNWCVLANLAYIDRILETGEIK